MIYAFDFAHVKFDVYNKNSQTFVSLTDHATAKAAFSSNLSNFVDLNVAEFHMYFNCELDSARMKCYFET